MSAGCQGGPKKFWRIAAVFAATGALVLSGCSSKSEESRTDDGHHGGERREGRCNREHRARGHQVVRKAGRRRQHSVHAQRVQGPQRQDRRLRRRSDERDRRHARPDRRSTARRTSPRSSRRSRATPSTSGCRRSPTPRSASRRSTSSPTSRPASCGPSRPGAGIDPDNACGKKVAVQATTTEETVELPAKSKACTDAGKPAIDIIKFDGQDAATNAVVLGQADAMSADSPVTLYAHQAEQRQARDRPARSPTPRRTAGR